MTTIATRTTTDANNTQPSRMRIRMASGWSLFVPILVVYVAIYYANAAGTSVQQQAQYAMANLVIVVGLQAFIGTSGVLSLGHISFVAVGAWTMGILLASPSVKKSTISTMFPFLIKAHTGFWTALLLAAVLGGLLAALVAPVLMRLNGLQAGIATFAFLAVVNEVLANWKAIGPASSQQGFFFSDPSISMQTLLFIAITAIIVSWLYQRSTTARLLRATREGLTAAPASGINVTPHRIIALTVSGVLCGVGGGLLAQVHGSIDPSQVSVQLTFTTISMLVLGGMLSLWGAVLGTLIFSALDFLLQQASTGLSVGNLVVTVPSGVHDILLGALLVTMLLFRPDGLTRGHEFTWPFLRHNGGSRQPRGFASLRKVMQGAK